MNVEDNIGNTTFLAFGTPAEKMIVFSANKMSSTVNRDKFVFPDLIRNKLIGKTVMFTISIVRRAMDADNISFRVNTSRILNPAQQPSSYFHRQKSHRNHHKHHRSAPLHT